jgi:hypothetical protein
MYILVRPSLEFPVSLTPSDPNSSIKSLSKTKNVKSFILLATLALASLVSAGGKPNFKPKP